MRRRAVTPPRVAGWSCEHMMITAGSMAAGSVIGPCGCDMQPVYANP